MGENATEIKAWAHRAIQAFIVNCKKPVGYMWGTVGMIYNPKYARKVYRKKKYARKRRK